MLSLCLYSSSAIILEYLGKMDLKVFRDSVSILTFKFCPKNLIILLILLKHMKTSINIISKTSCHSLGLPCKRAPSSASAPLMFCLLFAYCSFHSSNLLMCIGALFRFLNSLIQSTTQDYLHAP